MGIENDITHLSDNAVKDILSSLDERDREFLSQEFKRIDDDDYDYVDNHRMAIVGNSSQEREYQKRLDDGCCGYFDKEYELPSGKRVRFGFNWGH